MDKEYIAYFDRKFGDIDKRFDKLEDKVDNNTVTVSVIQREHDTVKHVSKVIVWCLVSAFTIYQTFLKLKGEL